MPSAVAARLLPERVLDRARPLLAWIDAIATGEDDRAHAQRMALTAYVMRVASAGIAYLSQIALARWMGSFEYGIFVVVWTWVTILGVVANLGFSSAVIRLVPEYMATGQSDLLRGVILGSRLVSFLSGTVLAGLGIAGLFLFGDKLAQHYLLPLYLGTICLPLFTVTEVQDGISRAFNWSDLAFGPTFLWRPLLILVCLFGVHLLGANLTAVTAGVVTIGATWATGVLQLVAMGQRFRTAVGPGPRAYRWGFWLAVALPLFLIDGLNYLLLSTDIIILSQFAPPNEVAVYYATAKTLALVHFVYFAVKAASAHRFALLFHSGDQAGLNAYLHDSVRWTFWPSLAVAMVLLLAGRFLLSLFGPGFEAGYPLLFILVVGVLARAALGPIEALLIVAGQQRATVVIYVVTFLANVALGYLLVPRLGLLGAAIATSTVMAGEAIALYLLARSRLGLRVAVIGRTKAPEPPPHGGADR